MEYLKQAIFSTGILLFPLMFLLLLGSCSNNDTDYAYDWKPGNYLNHHDSVAYLGMNVCKECHITQYQSFVRTGMGKSWDHASRQKSAAVIGPDSMIYDQYKDLIYKPFWDTDTLKLREYRLESARVIHDRVQAVDYVVGSGQHTNSHIYSINGYTHQVPFTFYTQDSLFDLPPGFEGGHNTRFERKIGLECLSCHNNFPDMVLGSENKYTMIPTGIECERCHGPGEVHVYLKKKGVVIDTSKHIDYSIVNPGKLPPKLQLDLCARCHLQGTMVLKPDKSFYDFKPGMELTTVMDIFMPLFDGGKEDFIMASHYERFLESPCYSENGNFTCISCHYPHLPAKETLRSKFNNSCSECHIEGEHFCKLDYSERLLENNECVICHMRLSLTRDIPHVKIHDHKISKPPTEKELNSVRKFKGLVAVNNRNTDRLTMAKGYLLEHEAYHPSDQYLDSARHYLEPLDEFNEADKFNAVINYLFLRGDHEAIISTVEILEADAVLNTELLDKDFSNYDAWTAYRIGQAFELDGSIETAYRFYGRAVLLAKYNLEFQNKFGSTSLILGHQSEAKKTFEFILSENPLFISTHVNMGFLYLNSGDFRNAEKYYKIALDLDPDHIQALLNLAGLRFLQDKDEEGMVLIERVLELDEENVQALRIVNSEQ